MPDRTTDLMVDTLQEGLSQLRGRALRIRELHRTGAPSSFNARTERLRVVLEGHEWLPVFFKNLSPRRGAEPAAPPAESDLSLSRRELLMYRSILSRERFGTPQLYAFRWEP